MLESLTSCHSSPSLSIKFPIEVMGISANKEKKKASVGSTHPVVNREKRSVSKKSGNSKKPTTLILLLGVFGCGKTTIRKQLQFIYKGDPSKEELENYKNMFFSNILVVTQQIIQYAFKNKESEAADWRNNSSFTLISNLRNVYDIQITSEIVNALKEIWTIQKVRDLIEVAVREDLQMVAKYYKDNVEWISSPDYTPTKMDILLARQRTSGISEMTLEFKNMYFSIVDAGGQTSERRKWNTFIKTNDVVIYCLAIDSYAVENTEPFTGLNSRSKKSDQDEDDNSKAIVPKTLLDFSMAYFQEVVQRTTEQNKPLIVFLNKIDLFEEKLKVKPLKEVYDDYEGNSVEDAKAYIENKVKAITKGKDGVYIYFLCALDTDLVKKVFKSVKDHIISSRLIRSELF